MTQIFAPKLAQILASSNNANIDANGAIIGVNMESEIWNWHQEFAPMVPMMAQYYMNLII